MKKIAGFLSILLFTIPLLAHASLAGKESVDLVVFSFNRPLQLYAFLESCEKHLSDLGKTHVIIRSSADAYTQGYALVAKRFPKVKMLFQKNAPYDFKKLVLKSVFSKKSKSPYFMFAVDDMIVTEKVDLRTCAKALKKHKEAWFFSLRLGKNIVYCGMLHHDQPVPKGKKIGRTMHLWKFRDVKAQGDWNYPNTTDTTIYRKKDIVKFLKRAEYTNPNILEGAWVKTKPGRKKGLCFTHSSVINIPLNVVNPYFTNENMGIGVEGLLDLFMNGYKIDIDAFYQVNNPSPHVKYTLSYTKR